MTSPKIILAFDTAMGACSAALYNSETNQTLAEKYEPMNRGQAERLVPMIDEIIKDAAIDYADINLITCTHGPGAFTGVRLSLATAKALSLSLNIPAVGISTLEAVLNSLPASEDNILSSDANSYMSCLETKRKDYYTQVFDKNKKPITAPQAKPLIEVEKDIKHYKPIIIGDAVTRLKEEYGKPLETHEIYYVRCTSLAKMGKEKFRFGCAHLQDMSPVYLRGADVSFPATKK